MRIRIRGKGADLSGSATLLAVSIANICCHTYFTLPVTGNKYTLSYLILPNSQISSSSTEVFAETDDVLLLVGEERRYVPEGKVLDVHPQPDQFDILAIL